MKSTTGARRLRAGTVAAAVALGLVGTGGPAGATIAADAAAEAGSARLSARIGGGWSADEWPAGAGTTLRTVRSIIKADTGTAANLTGQGVGIALVDTGVAPVDGLPPGQLVNGPDLSFESQSGQLRYLDTFGHGTHMAGIIVANDTASGTVGLAPKAKLTSVKVGTANGANDVSQVIAAIDWVVQNRNYDPSNPIRVMNLSFGSSSTAASTIDPLMFAVEQAWQAGIVVVAAGGNDGSGTASLTNPAMDPFVVSVGAATNNNTTATSDDDVASFTNNAAASRKIDLLAPGVSIASLRTEGSNIDEQYPLARVGNTLFKGSGTSQAAAVTSAAAALLLQNRPSLTPDQVKQLLVAGASPLTTGTAGQKGMKELNVSASVAMATPSVTQNFTKGSGLGSLETSRGGNHLTADGIPLNGEFTLFGPFSPAVWAQKAATKTSWSGGTWMGWRIAGDTWTGAGGAGGTGQISGWYGKCVDIAASGTANNTQIQLYDCNNTGAQYWSFNSDGTIRALGKCMDTLNTWITNGAKVVLYDCNSSRTTQKWTVNSNRQIVNNASGTCLDVTDFKFANGTPMQIWTCGNNDNQRWVPPYTSRTWAAATWQGTPWTGTGSWADPEWAERFWTGHYWSGHYWSGHYWSADDWATQSWS